MKKTNILLLIIFLSISPVPVFGSGQKNKDIIVPGGTVAVARIDVQKNLSTGNAPLLLDLLYTFQDRGYLEKPGKAILDDQLTELSAIKLEDIETVTLSLLSFSLLRKELPYGVHIKLKQDLSKKIQQYIKDTYSPEVNKYRGKMYFVFKQAGQKACLYSTGKELFFSRDSSIMESMLDILYGSDSVQDNQALYNLIKEYTGNPFYCAGYIPEDADSDIPYLCDQVKEFGLTITVDKDISFQIKAGTYSRKLAGELITTIKGNLALLGILMLTQNKKAYPILAELIQGINYEQKGSCALISGRFTEKDMRNLLDMAPGLFMMMK
ncbi:MAG: hypothetical protein JXB88_05805 [Spirochaetales bacterium]|nr:hypothetical protein [Spirochaetales bacterium]